MQIDRWVGRLLNTISKVDQQGVERLAELLMQTEGMVWIIGNGGSAANAEHAANDFLKVAGLPSMSLTVAPTLTAYANDEGYEFSFAHPVAEFVRERDVLLALSVSGTSPNIVEAVKEAKRQDAMVIGLFGPKTSKNKGIMKILDDYIVVPEEDYGIVETVHQGILHALALAVKEKKNA